MIVDFPVVERDDVAIDERLRRRQSGYVQEVMREQEAIAQDVAVGILPASPDVAVVIVTARYDEAAHYLNGFPT
jgi:hypothetical protein